MKLAKLLVLLTIATVASPETEANDLAYAVRDCQSTKLGCRSPSAAVAAAGDPSQFRPLTVAVHGASDEETSDCMQPAGCMASGVQLQYHEEVPASFVRTQLSEGLLRKTVFGRQGPGRGFIAYKQAVPQRLRLRKLHQSGSSSSTDTPTDRSGTMFPRPKTQWKRAWALQKDGVGRPGFVTRNNTASARKSEEKG